MEQREVEAEFQDFVVPSEQKSMVKSLFQDDDAPVDSENLTLEDRGWNIYLKQSKT